MAIGDIIMLKDGTSINGEVITKAFILKTKFGDIKLKKSDILTVHFKNKTQFSADEVQISAGTRLEGDFQPAVFDIRIEELDQVVQINKSDIGTLIFFTGSRKEISGKAQKLVAKINKTRG